MTIEVSEAAQAWCQKQEINGVIIERLDVGWIFRAGNRKFGPVRDLSTISSIEVAEKLGVDTSTALKAKLTASYIELSRPLSIDDISEMLESIIKRDRVAKVLVFLTMLSCYTESDQLNLALKGESSTGKSYIALAVSELFPSEDIIMVAYASPTAFFHEVGELDEESKTITVDLSNKIIIFLDQPHDLLLERLRPLLSHDRKELTYKITDKQERKGLRTKTVKLIGFPAVVFCTGHLGVDLQEATRMLLVSPETSSEKIRESILFKAKTEGNQNLLKIIEEDEGLSVLRERVKMVKNSGIRKVIIPNAEEVASRFMESRERLKPRHMRDISKIFCLIKCLALLNFMHRPREGDTIIASGEDIEQAFRLYNEVAAAQELGVPPYALEIYQKIILPESQKSPKGGITRRELMEHHLKVFGRPLSENFLKRELIPALEGAGLIIEEPDPDNKHRLIIKPLMNDFQNSGSGVGGKYEKGCDLPHPPDPLFLNSMNQGICEFCGEGSDNLSIIEFFGQTRLICGKCREGMH
ncbi:MAG: hypothetical protein RMJ14_00015 [Nitrososphaerota archaeon]|nr:hypothetical protein [Nitrososphaerota archaeon]